MSAKPGHFLTIGLFALLCASAVHGAADPNSVLILVNDAVAPETGTGGKGASVFVGEYYATKRGIPFSHIVHLNIPLPAPQSFDGQFVSFAVFNTLVRQPVKTFLQTQGWTSTIKYIVPTYGIPVALTDSPVPLTGGRPESFPTELFSIDSFLASLNSGSDNLYVVNPYAVNEPTYQREHFATWVNPLGWNMYLVTRLDGPTALIAAGLVDKAMQAEASLTRSSGTGYFDWKNQQGNPVDGTMKRAYDLSTAMGSPSVLNNQSVTGSMITSAPNTLWAWGWYSGPSTCNCYSFAPGAVGAQLTSYTANRLRSLGPGTWVPEWLNAGITATWGATTEPYSSGYAYGDNLLNHFWMGYNFGEAAYLASPSLNWAMVFVGDPLYSPPIFNTSITPATFPRVVLTGTKSGQFYTGSITFSLTLPTSPAVAGVTFQMNDQAVTQEITAPPYRASGTLHPDSNGPHRITAKIRYTSGAVIVTDPLPALIYNTPIAAPVFSPAPGTYSGPVSVTITTTASNAVIRYTLDGSAPTSNSPAATGPITISTTTGLRAVAFVGTSASSVTEGVYTINGGSGGGGDQPANGPMTPASGTATTRTFQWPGVSSISYVMGVIDGSNGSGNPARYCWFQYMPGTNQISLANDSGVMQAFTALGSGSLSNSRCTLNSASSSRTIVNGTLTLNLAFSFTASFNGTWPVFMAYRALGADSPVWNQAGTWTVATGTSQQVATPTFNPPAGTYGSGQSVSIATTTVGAFIRYTTDGSTPTSSTGILYSGAVNVASSQTFRAIAYASGMSDSAMASAAYTINSGGGGGTPSNGPMMPASGTATTRTFQWPGVSSISYVMGIIDAGNGSNCWFQYLPGTNQISLANDSGVMQPFITLGAGSLSNSRCTLNSAASTLTVANGTLTLGLSFSFTASFNGTWPVWVAYRVNGADAPVWGQAGTWTISGSSPGPGPAPSTPSNGPMTPSSGTATTRTFQWPGVSSISYVMGLIDASNGNGAAANNCWFQYLPSTNQISLSDDSGGMQPFRTLGSGSLSNGKCTLNVAASSQSVVNGTLSLTLSFSFAPTFHGTWPVWVAYRAVGSDSPSWSSVGSWTN